MRPRARRADPFALLGLSAGAGLTDDDVRSAWRRVATATHPDRPDGGDPERFAAAAAAYTVLRTPFGRSEALADLGSEHPLRVPFRRARVRPRQTAAAWPRLRMTLARLGSPVRRGRPLRVALRAGAAATAGWAAVAAAGWKPATVALIAGALTWFLLTVRHDLAPPG